MHDKHINARKAYRPALKAYRPALTSPHNAKQDWKQHHENIQQGKTQHEAPHSKNHKGTQSKNHTRTSAFEQSVA